MESLVPIKSRARPRERTSMPRINKRSLCVEESILLPTGDGVQTVMLDERYTPYKKQSTRIENLCGSFTEFVHVNRLEGATRRQGNQRELFHVQGNVIVNQGKALFLAARGAEGLEQLARAMNLSSADNVTHMIVLTSKIGKRVQVCSHGLLERTLARQRDQVKVKGRIFEHTNSVCFSLTRRDTLPLSPHEPSPHVSDADQGQVRQAALLPPVPVPPRQERLDRDGQGDGDHPAHLAAALVGPGGRGGVHDHVQPGDGVAPRVLLSLYGTPPARGARR